MNCVLLAKMDKVLVKKQNTKKILENWKKHWKSQRILSVWKSGNPVIKKKCGRFQGSGLSKSRIIWYVSSFLNKVCQ